MWVVLIEQVLGVLVVVLVVEVVVLQLELPEVVACPVHSVRVQGA